MPLNWSGTLAAFHALVHPRLILPDLIVQDIRSLNFAAFRKAGYRAVVLDKDNCLTYPHQDSLISELEYSWEELKNEFGASNLLIVSNSAGTRHDAGGLAAESVSHNLGVPVLRHSSLKPSHRTITGIQRYFASLPSPISDPRELIVIGDRVLTDIVLAKRLEAYSILVSRDWTRSFKIRSAAAAERSAVRLARRWVGVSPPIRSDFDFVKPIPRSKGEVRLSYSGSTWSWTGRAIGLGPNSGKHY